MKVLLKGGNWLLTNQKLYFSWKRQILSYVVKDEHVTYSSNNLEQIFSVFHTHVHPIFRFFWIILLQVSSKLEIIHVHSCPMLAKHVLQRKENYNISTFLTVQSIFPANFHISILHRNIHFKCIPAYTTDIIFSRSRINTI